MAMAAVTVVFGDTKFSAPLYVDTFVPGVAEDGWMLGLGLPVRYMKARITIMTAIFFGITAIFHIGPAQIWPQTYIENIAMCKNPARWLEYALSAPIMCLCIAYFCGSMHVFVLIALFALTQTTMLFGFLSEEIVRPLSAEAYKYPLFLDRISVHVLGYVPQAYCWLIILWQFADAATRSSTTLPDGSVQSMPTWVYALVFVQMSLFWSFGAVQLWQLYMPPKHYYRGEIAYMILSATAKIILGAFLLANALTIS